MNIEQATETLKNLDALRLHENDDIGKAIRAVTNALIWKPIATAPKDQWILGYCDKVTVQTRYFPNIESWELPWRVQVEYGGKWQPTHWMPLPQPPAS